MGSSLIKTGELTGYGFEIQLKKEKGTVVSHNFSFTTEFEFRLTTEDSNEVLTAKNPFHLWSLWKEKAKEIYKIDCLSPNAANSVPELFNLNNLKPFEKHFGIKNSEENN